MPKAKTSNSLKASCLQEDLAKGLSIVARAVAARSTLPILGNIKIASDPSSLNRIMLQATNLEIGITHFIAGHINGEGAITVPARSFVDLINAMPSDELVELDVNPKTQSVSVACGRFINNVKGTDAEEFPVIPMGSKALASVEANDLHGLIDRVAFAAASDESRPILTGVYTELSSAGILMAAADGFRLSVDRVIATTDIVGILKMIVPSRAVSELARIMGDQKDEVAISVSFGADEKPSQIVFGLTCTTLVSQLIDGTYPDYDAIVPKASQTTIAVEGTALFMACKQANVFAREAANIISLTTRDDGTIAIQAQSAETGDNLGIVDATVTGPQVTIAFNVKYLNDLLKVLEKRPIMISLNTAVDPGMFSDSTHANFHAVIMPMSIGGRVTNNSQPDGQPADPTPVQNEGQNDPA